ncbi:hypothetical protein FAK_07060 [Desulfoferula mesophila]|uniref:DUF1508 domain-containing protein n=1 Tax=Desulfoferula mesophila TaxID=3058419 RepID=A0AAU9ECE0_9BACT|nr:hypothetical protein FAK_07060 [Desulfoferula mesophilus]
MPAGTWASLFFLGQAMIPHMPRAGTRRFWRIRNGGDSPYRFVLAQRDGKVIHAKNLPQQALAQAPAGGRSAARSAAILAR